MSQPSPLATAPVCVIGAGTMGRGIAQVALAAGHRVYLVDPASSQLQAATADIIARLTRKNPDAGAQAEQRLLACTDLTEIPADPRIVVIEAVLEDLEVKQTVFRKAVEHFGSDCILATNTSSLSVTAIAAGVPDPSRVVGMHFFNPVPVMKLVEVVRGLQTAEHVAQSIAGLAVSWGKAVAHVRSVPGFIVNRVARAFYGEALRLVEEHATTPDVIDELLRGAGFRMGPFELMDLIGNDVNYAVTRTVWTSYHFDPRFAPSLIQGELVASGAYGRKSGRGFYDYGDGSERPRAVAAVADPAALPNKVVLHGRDTGLATICTRAGLEASIGDGDGPSRLELPAIGSVVVTRGRTAAAESADRGEPVLVLDRWLDPATTTAVAFAAGDASLANATVALLDRAGVRAFPTTDVPGLVVARVLSMIANEAWETAYHQVATPTDIDIAMELATNYPLGPFAWTERWSIAGVLTLIDELWTAYHDPRYRASQALRAAATISDSPAPGPGRN